VIYCFRSAAIACEGTAAEIPKRPSLVYCRGERNDLLKFVFLDLVNIDGER
jgi:hypothetical protein